MSVSVSVAGAKSMISISENYVEAAAPSADAARNGRALVLKKKFIDLHRSPDDTLLFGRCQGSGKTPYLCSADFAEADKPVYRCSCPSRQFPCKHTLGLLFAYTQGLTFTIADVPDELLAKREKAVAKIEKQREKQREKEKQEEAPASSRKVNKSALAKKIRAQLDGIDLLEKLTRDLVRIGIGNMNAKTASELEEHAKQLGNAYLPGAQNALRSYTQRFRTADGDDLSTTEREAVYSEALEQLGTLQALIGKGRTYLGQRLEDPDLAPETDTDIAAWLGHAWQLRELKELGRVLNKVELVQLAFNTYFDEARREYVDDGAWMDLSTGQVYTTKTFRPLHAAKFVKSDDSFFEVAGVDELFVYPGDANPRVRWEGMVPRPVTPADLDTVRRLARVDFSATVKDVKARLKNPLGDKHPIFVLKYARIGRVGTSLVVESEAKERLVFTDAGMSEEPPSGYLLEFLPASLLEAQALVVRFRHDLDTRQLRIKPLSIVTCDQILRLTF